MGSIAGDERLIGGPMIGHAVPAGKDPLALEMQRLRADNLELRAEIRALRSLLRGDDHKSVAARFLNTSGFLSLFLAALLAARGRFVPDVEMADLIGLVPDRVSPVRVRLGQLAVRVRRALAGSPHADGLQRRNKGFALSVPAAEWVIETVSGGNHVSRTS